MKSPRKPRGKRHLREVLSAFVLEAGEVGGIAAMKERADSSEKTSINIKNKLRVFIQERGRHLRQVLAAFKL
jgi:hypothetical protein